MRIFSSKLALLVVAAIAPATVAQADILATSGIAASRTGPLSLFASPSRPVVAQPVVAQPVVALPGPAIATQGPGMQCRQAIRAAEQAAAIPSQLMAAIGRVESGRRDAQGQIDPWPWSINVEGIDHIYETKAEAIAAVRRFQAAGRKSIDIGCMQVNLMFHPTAFASLEQAFDPVANARYAARYLRDLFSQTGSWEKATAFYHSATPELGTPYQQKVATVLPEEQKRLATTNGNVWSNNVWTNNVWNSAGTAPAGGGFRLSNHAEAAKIIPAPPGTIGRTLAAYRAAAVR